MRAFLSIAHSLTASVSAADLAYEFFAWVMLGMLSITTGHKHQVFGPVIAFVLINMVNKFALSKESPKNALHNQPMFTNVAIISAWMVWAFHHHVSIWSNKSTTVPARVNRWIFAQPILITSATPSGVLSGAHLEWFSTAFALLIHMVNYSDEPHVNTAKRQEMKRILVVD